MAQEAKNLTEVELFENAKRYLDLRLEYLKSCRDYSTNEAHDRIRDITFLAESLYGDEDYKKICGRVVDFMLEHGLAQLIVNVLMSLSGRTDKGACKFRVEIQMVISYLAICIEKPAAGRIKLELVKCGAVQILLTELDSCDPNTNDPRQRLQITLCIFSLHNLVSTPDVIPIYLAANAVTILTQFSEADNVMTTIYSVMVLAVIVNEKESHRLSTSGGCIKTMVKMLQKTVSSEYKWYRITITVDGIDRYFETGVRTLAEAFANLSSNDANKDAIVQHGGVSALASVIRPEHTIKQKQLAIVALWKLAYLHPDVILSHLTCTDTACLQELKRLRSSDDPTLRDDSQGLLHQLGLLKIHEELPIEALQAPSISRTQQQQRDTSASCHESEQITEVPHVMISYKWDQQEKAMKVCKKLKERGYNVWLDFEKLEGDILKAMANAVEKADAVLVCVSRSYKFSANCQREASYAHLRGKPIIPLMMEEDYAPDGWLGLLIAMKKYIRAFSDDVLQKDMPHLIRELGNRGRVVSVSGQPTYKRLI